jgi:hypothetical protein
VLLEGLDGLGLAIFKQGELIFLEAVDGMVVAVGDNDVDNDELGAGLKRGQRCAGWRLGGGRC